MLRIYEVVLQMIREAAPVADAIERHDRDLARQMRRALTSVALNTAEGAGSLAGHKQQRYQTALGSVREVQGCIDAAKALRYIKQVDPGLLDRIDHVTATLVRLVHPRR
jgi:four helix bundle protein